MTRHVVLVLFVILMSLSLGRAEIFSYVDSGGTVHYVDDAGKIPKLQRKNKKIVDEEPAPGAVPNATVVRVVGNQVLVPVTLRHNEKTVQGTFLLDTGASTTTISDALAERLGFTSGRLVLGQVAGGGLLTAMRVRLDSLAVGPKSRMDIDIDVIRHNGPSTAFDGLLGMNFLKKYRYVIDLDEQLIRWE